MATQEQIERGIEAAAEALKQDWRDTGRMRVWMDRHFFLAISRCAIAAYLAATGGGNG